MHENQARLLAAVMGPAPTGGDLASVFDEEVGRLPKRQRVALVLCCLQGVTEAEAAHRLGRPPESMKPQMARACRVLRARLAWRGAPVSVAELSDFLISARAAGPVPAPLFEATVRAGMAVLTGESDLASPSSTTCRTADGA
jgi:hypothetical protein